MCLARFVVSYNTLYGGADAGTQTLANEISQENQNDAIVSHNNSRAEVIQENQYKAVVDVATDRPEGLVFV